jgi:hypothetical protein
LEEKVPIKSKFPVSSFSSLEPSVYGYYLCESVSFGKIWINVEDNVLRNLPEFNEILMDILKGKDLNLSSAQKIAEKYKKFSKR